MGIHGKTICEQLWGEEGGCYCFSSDVQLSDGVLLRNGGQSRAWSQQSCKQGKQSLASTCYYHQRGARPPSIQELQQERAGVHIGVTQRGGKNQ